MIIEESLVLETGVGNPSRYREFTSCTQPLLPPLPEELRSPATKQKKASGIRQLANG